MVATELVAVLVRREFDDDYVEFWTLPWHIRRIFPDAGDSQVRRVSEAVLTALLETGIVLGNIDWDSGAFLRWPTSGAVEKVMTAWRLLGRDPNMGDVCWLATTDGSEATELPAEVSMPCHDNRIPGDESLSPRESFLVMSDFIWRFAQRTGDDLLTLIGDTGLECDGGPTDSAAWDDWMDSVFRIRSGRPPRGEA